MKKITLFLLSLLLLSIISGQGKPVPADAQESIPPSISYLPVVRRDIALIPQRIGPDVGRVLRVGRDAASPSNLYAMTFGSGVYKSTDSGVNWTPSSAGISYLTLQAMAVDPVTPGTIYVGTYGDNSVPYDGVFKSSDGGSTWQATGEIANVWNGTRYKWPVVYALAVDSLNPNRVFAGTRMKYLPGSALGGGGVFRSDNGGVSWAPVNSGLPYEDLYVYDLAIDPAHPGRVYAALHQHGLYRSDNYGSSWYSLSGTPYAGRAVAVDPFDSNIIYFGAVKKLGIHRSTNAGMNWTQIGGVGWDATYGSLSVDPNHPGVIYSGILVNNTVSKLVRSTDRGDSWNTAAGIDASGKIAFSPDGRTRFIGVDFDGPYRSEDNGQSWQRSAAGVTGFSVTGLAISPADSSRLYAGLYGLGVYTSTDRGLTWTSTSSGLEYQGILALASDPGNASVLYAATDQSAVFRSTNGGQSWGVLSSGYPNASPLPEPGSAAPGAGERPASPFENRPLPERDDLKEDPEAPSLRSQTAAAGLAPANCISVSPASSGVVLVGTNGRGVYWLNGSSWAASSLASGTVYNIIFDRAVAGRVLAAAGASSGGVLVSANNGQSWQAFNTGLSGRSVYSLAQGHSNSSFFLAGTDSGVYQSFDGGSSWSIAGLPGQAVKAVSVLPFGEDLLFAATASAVSYYYSNSDGWLSMNEPFNNIGIQGVLPDPSGQSIYIYSRLGGAIRLDIR